MNDKLPPFPDRWARVYENWTANPSWNNAREAQEPQMGQHIGVVRYVAVPDSFIPAICPICNNQYVIAVAGPDENGQYDTEDCPCQVVDDDTLGAMNAELREGF